MNTHGAPERAAVKAFKLGANPRDLDVSFDDPAVTSADPFIALRNFPITLDDPLVALGDPPVAVGNQARPLVVLAHQSLVLQGAQDLHFVALDPRPLPAQVLCSQRDIARQGKQRRRMFAQQGGGLEVGFQRLFGDRVA